MLEIINLNVQYLDQVILSNINCIMHPSEVIGLYGKNGAGKSTLFNAIDNNINFSGQILLDNQPIKKDKVAFLETENYFYPYITGAEYLSYFFNKKNQNHQQWVPFFNLPLHQYIHQYSSGMKKKIALLGVLLLDRPIIILDEPFNGVDYETVLLIYDIVKLLKTQNKIVLMSSHITETLQTTCDKIFSIKDTLINKVYLQEDYHLLK